MGNCLRARIGDTQEKWIITHLCTLNVFLFTALDNIAEQMRTKIRVLTNRHPSNIIDVHGCFVEVSIDNGTHH